jgi:hypothetical protein
LVASIFEFENEKKPPTRQVTVWSEAITKGVLKAILVTKQPKFNAANLDVSNQLAPPPVGYDPI